MTVHSDQEVVEHHAVPAKNYGIDSQAAAQAWELEELLKKDAQDSTNEEPEDKSWRKYAKIILPHVGLILLSCIYVVSGAIVFYHLERPHELNTRKENLRLINEQKTAFLDKMWDLSKKVNENVWRSDAFKDIENITKHLFDAFDTHYIDTRHLTNDSSSQGGDVWTFNAAIFFTSTLLTTIGYGNLVPVTFEGRVFCICYGLLGVPLVLITVTDIGKFLAEHITALYGFYVKFKERLHVHYLSLCARRRRHGRTPAAESDSPLMPNERGAGETATNVEEGRSPEQPSGPLDELEKFGMTGLDINVPTPIILTILVGYMALGALLLSFLEGWSFFDAFYFAFITMTTVGFGDFVPEEQAYFMLDMLYIVIGLAITTMCIDLVGAQYIEKIHNFGRAINDARYALVNVGGKMVQVHDIMKYAALLHKKYGLTDAKARIIDNPLTNPYPDAYTPKEIKFIRYIDYVASKDSLHKFYARPDSMNSSSSSDEDDAHFSRKYVFV